MQAVQEATSSGKVRELFRRSSHTHGIPFHRELSKTSQKIYARLHRKINAATQGLRFSSEPVLLTRIRYPIAGSNLIESVHYTEPGEAGETGRIWINQTQYFEGVSPAIWYYSLGGRFLCQQWLIDRQGSTLSEQSLQQYQRIVMILKDVIELMAGVDEAVRPQPLPTLTPAVAH